MTKLAKDGFGNTLPAWRLGKAHPPLYVGEEPQLSEPFGQQTSVVLVYATVDARIKFGAPPEAEKRGARLPAGIWAPLRVFGGERMAVEWCGEEGEIEITETE